MAGGQAHSESLPTRGAWIETLSSPRLRVSRSPHGGRGLKLFRAALKMEYMQVAPHTLNLFFITVVSNYYSKGAEKYV